MGLSDALRGRLAAAEAEREALQAQLLHAPIAPARPPMGGVLARYRSQMLDLQRVLTEGAMAADLARTREVLAAMLGPVTIGRDPTTGENYAELEEPAERLLITAVGESLGMVAGGRNSSRRRIVLG